MIPANDIASYRLPLSAGMLVLLLGWEVAQPFFANFTRGPEAWKRRGLNAAINLGLGLLNGAVVAGVFVSLWAAATAWAESHDFGLLHLLPAQGLWRTIRSCALRPTRTSVPFSRGGTEFFGR
jgi:hypothetical protein